MKKTKNHQHAVQYKNLQGYDESQARLNRSRAVFIAEDVTTQLGSDLSALLLYFDALNNDEITIYIHTDGGDVAGLTNIYDVMMLLNSPIKTVCTGKAYSAGAVLLAAGTVGRRFAFKNSNIMIHGIQATFPLPGEDLVNSKNYYDFLKHNNNNLMKILAYHTGHNLNKILEDCAQDKYMSAKQAKEYGLIDEIIG